MRLRVLNEGDEPSDRRNDPLLLSRELLHAAREDLTNEGLGEVRKLAMALTTVRLEEGLRSDAQRHAFWLNIYNALSRHAFAASGVSGSLLLHLGILSRSAYVIAGQSYSLDLIEHGLLRGNRRPPLSLRKLMRAEDPRRLFAPTYFDPRIHFALNCGAQSCPPIRSYNDMELEAQLTLATQAYIDAETTLDIQQRTLSLPRLCKYYASDFGDRAKVLAFIADHLGEPRASWLRANTARVVVNYRPYDWTLMPSASK